jgi:hypothetical protein
MAVITGQRVRLTVDEAQRLSEDARIIADHVMAAALCGYEYSGLPKMKYACRANVRCVSASGSRKWAWRSI